MSSDKTISVRMIIEVAGRPPEHLIETLNEIIKKISEEKGVNVEEKIVHEAVLMNQKAEPLADSSKRGQINEQNNFYTSFAEVEIKIEEISILSGLALKYMPAHIEIIEPELIAFTNNGWNDIFNEFLMRLHQYDGVARTIQTEKIILENKLKSLMPENKEEKKE